MILYCTQEKCIVQDSRNEGDFWLKKVLINVHSIINGTVFGRTPTMVSLLVVHSQKEVCKACIKSMHSVSSRINHILIVEKREHKHIILIMFERHWFPLFGI